MLWHALALTMVAQGDSEMRLMRFPDIYGDQVVFTYASDLWIASRNGGLARRLTSHPGTEANAKFSPDGKWVAFTGSYDGNPDVYVVSVEGGEPKRLTFEPDADIMADWTPDGRIAYVSGQNTPGSFTSGLRIVSPQGGLPTETKLLEVADVAFSPDGAKVAFDRNNSHTFNWRRYRGGTQGRIGFSDLNASTYTEIPSGRENRWNPMWVGDDVYYICDKTQGTRNLWVYDTKTKKESQVTKFDDADIKWPNTDGKSIVFEKNGYLMTYDIASKAISTLHPTVKGDLLSARPTLRNLAPMIRTVALSPSGARVAVEARGEIFSLPAKNGDTRNLTGGTSGVKESSPTWSPDGKTIAYLSDQSGEVQIMLQPQMGGEAKPLKTDPSHRITSFRYSPDGKKITYTTVTNDLVVFDLATEKGDVVYTGQFNNAENYDWSPNNEWIVYVNAGANQFGAIWMYNVAEKKSTKITEGYYNDSTATFDLNGKYVYFISSRTFIPTPGDFEFGLQMENSQRVYMMPLEADAPNPFLPKLDEEPTGDAQKPEEKKDPAPMKVDLAGMASRTLPLPWGPGSYQAVIGADNGVFVITGGALKKFDFDSRQPQDILGAGFTSLDFNAKRTKLAYAGPGGLVGISDVRPGIEVGVGRVNTSDVQAVINPREEWKQIFWEAWRWERDKYYDKNMLGLDWKAIGQQYAAYLPFVAHRADLNYVLGLMIGELGTGHAYVGGGDMGAGAAPVPVGALGADYEAANGKIRFKKIYRGLNFETERRGPLGAPGINVKDGDYLLAIDGKPLDANTSPHSLLVGRAGKWVNLLVNDKPTNDGARTVRVQTIADEGSLRYIEWVEGNRRKVAELSGGRIGYMHVPDTSQPGMIEFTKGYYSQSDKDALIVDERFNGGGMIPTFFTEKLSRRYETALRQRNGGDVGFPTQSIDGPKCMLINEYAGSGGDLFPWLFRFNKLGPLIGTRTWGGLVGIAGSAPLIDGGFLTSPEFGLYDLVEGKWIAENTGIDPDIQVDARPDAIAKGEDPQLAKAVEYLMGELKKGKRQTKRPDFPKVGKGGGN